MEGEYLTDLQKAPFLYLSDHPYDFHKPMTKALKSSTSKTSKLYNPCNIDVFRNTFFSDANMGYIQEMIKSVVSKKSCGKYKIGNQKYQHLYQIMEGIYEEHAQHLQGHQKEQMMILDKMTIDFCVETVLEEIGFRQSYLRDKYAKPTTLPEPINDSVAGTKAYTPTLSIGHDDYDIYTPKQTNNIYNKKVVLNPEDQIIKEDYQLNYKHRM